MKKNNNITKKERGLIKGALRRVFARSDLHRQVVDSTVNNYKNDPVRPRVKRWSSCQSCNTLTPTYKIVVDHVDPVIPVKSSLEEMSIEKLVNRIWCNRSNLQGICQMCHDNKTKQERDLRKEHKNGKRSKSKRTKKADSSSRAGDFSGAID